MAFAAVSVIGGCADTTLNDPIVGPSAPIDSTRDGRYTWPQLAAAKADPETLVILAISGGGKRSSAFSYGIMQGLRDYRIRSSGSTESLLSKLDFISGASGGSFTAAYYALHRERLFETYERAYLRRDINADIAALLLLPWNQTWLFDPFVGTNDEMARLYDRNMFRGATYADVAKRGLPLLVVNATDITRGTVFSFMHWQFEAICSDLLKYSVARAVAASNGFPFIFTPITLQNHAGKCKESPELSTALKQGDGSSVRHQHLAKIVSTYTDSAKTRFVHLMDGGIADNLALRGLINSLVLLGETPATVRAAGLGRVRRILVIIADGQSPFDTGTSQNRTVSGLKQILDAVSGTQIDAYNFETIQVMRQEFANLTHRIRLANCPAVDARCPQVSVHFAHLSVSGIPDDAVRTRIQKIPTSLTLDDADIDLLIQWGKRSVETSPDLQRFRQEMERVGPRRRESARPPAR